MASTLMVAPDFLTFFNEIAGGPKNGYRYLVDSNLDWGQNLWDLRRWMDENGADHVYYAHYSPARPTVYGIGADFLPPDPRAVDFAPWQPAPGLYAIGATVLQGPYAPDVNTYAWFRARESVARLGHALWVYRVAPQEAVAWIAICADVSLSPDAARANLGYDVARIIRPDCAQAFVYPTEGTGMYVVAPDTERPPIAQLELHARAPLGTPLYDVYRVAGSPTPESARAVAFLNSPLDFLGYRLDVESPSPGDTVVLQTYWRVSAGAGRPLSLMVHLLGSDGTGSAVGDGLGFSIEQWRLGDVIVQHHVLTLPPDAPSGVYTVIAGAYWLDTMERWSTDGGASHVVLGEIDVVP